MKWLIIPVLLAQTNYPINSLEFEEAKTFTTAASSIVSLQGVKKDGTPMKKGLIWCEGNWRDVSGNNQDEAGDYEHSPKFNTDSRGVTVFTVWFDAADMVCHAEGEGMAGVTRFHLASGERRFEKILIH